MNFTFGIAIGAVIAAVINVAFTYLSDRKRQAGERCQRVNRLFGELLNVLAHYQYFEIPMRLIDGDEKDHEEVVKRLELCKYGEFRAIESIGDFGFLNSTQIRNLHQLALRIRNTDLLIDKYIARKSENITEFRKISMRMGYISDTAELILAFICDIYPKYVVLIDQTKKLQNPSQGV